MIINNIHYKVYGKLKDAFLSFSSGLNVVKGVNEAGKSTVFNSISTMIYGFKPANQHKHPYANWQFNTIDFSSEIEFSGELYWVERRLKSAPKMNVVSKRTKQVKNFKNEPLPFGQNISEMLFSSVFHLTSEHLNQIEQLSWESIQEKLIFNYGSDYLKSLSEVVDSIEQEINALWRKDKRGNPLINQLNQELHVLKEQRHEAEKQYDLMKRSAKRASEIGKQLKHTLDSRRALESELKKMRQLLPIRNRESKISEIEASIFKKEAFKAMDQGLLTALANYEKQIFESNQKRFELHDAIQQQKLSLTGLSDHDEKLLKLKQSELILLQLLHEWESVEYDENQRMDSLIKLGERIESQHKFIFGVSITEKTKSAIKNLQVLELLTLFQKYLEASHQNKTVEKLRSLEKSHNKKLYAMLGFGGILMMSAGFAIESMKPLLFIGIVLTTFALSNIRIVKTKPLDELTDLTQLKKNILGTLGDINLPAYLWEDEDQRFFSRLEQLVLLILDEDQQKESWEHIHKKKMAIEEQVKVILSEHGIDSSRGVKLSLQYALSQLETAVGIKSKLDQQLAVIASKMEVLNTLDQDIRRLNEACEQIKDQLATFGDGNYTLGRDLYQRNLDLMGKLSVYLEERRHDQNMPIELENVSEERIADLEFKLEQFYAVEKQLITEQITIKAEIEQLESIINIDELNGQMMIIQERISEALDKRNQLMVLLEVIKFSDMRYRLENQPNLIQRASHFFKTMTLGKYEEVLISDENGMLELQVLVDGEIIPASRAFSKGTVHQLFLAFRLAVIEALDPECNLPLLLDEALVNFDIFRFEATIKLLMEVSEKRQIFYFTCHDHFANRIMALTGRPAIEVI